MVQFKSRAREGSFSDNQLVAPDNAVAHIKNEGSRVLQGMSDAQAYLNRNQEIFLQAQKQAQGIEASAVKTIHSINDENLKAEQNATELAWKRELAKKQAQDKYKIDSLGAIANFAKTALDVSSSIVKQNKEIQLKAINQLSFKHKWSHKDVLAAKSVNSSITKAAFQETQMVKQLIAEGKSQEYINAMYDHLVKGGGYRNYIANSTVLREQARINAQIVRDISMDPTLTPDQKRLKMDEMDAKLRGELTIDGVTPGMQILEKAYNPIMQRALDRGAVDVNREKSAALKRDNEIAENQILNDAAWQTGSFNWPATSEVLSHSPSPNGVTNGVNALINGANRLTLDNLYQMKYGKIFINGKATSIAKSFPEAMVLIKQAEKEVIRADRAALVLAVDEIRLTALMDTNELAQKLADDDGLFSSKDYRTVEQNYYNKAGQHADPSVLLRFKAQTTEARLIPVMREEFEELRKNNNLSMAVLMESGAPKVLVDEYRGAAQYQDTLRATPQYKGLNKYLAQEITGAVMDVKDIGYKNASNTQSHEFNWFLGEQVKKYRKQVLDLVQTGMNINDAMELIGKKAATESKKFLLKKETFDGYGLVPYRKDMEGAKKEQLIAQRKVTKLRALTPTQLKDPNEWLNLMGVSALNEASKKLEETGRSEVLAAIAQNTGLTTYEVQHKIAGLSDMIEPIEMNPTWEQIQNEMPPSMRYTFTSNKPTNEQRLRVLQQERNQRENRNTIPVRSVFQQQQVSAGEDPPPEGSLTKQQVNELAVSVGFPAGAAHIVSQIAYGESGRDPTNSTRRSGLYAKSGEDSVGLMQINWGVHKDSGWLQELGINKREDLFDPVLNMKAALYLYNRSKGFGDWTVYTSGEYAGY